LPLLHACGYLPREIVPQLRDDNRKLPDYTILPNSSWTWYLEAKAWHVVLEESQIKQALDYANHNGRRWVVLSNGKAWRLYDNSIQGLAPQKLVSEVYLEDTDAMRELLAALGKDSITAEGIVSYAELKLSERRERERQARITNFLASQITNPASAMITAILGTLQVGTGLTNVDPQEVVSFFLNRGGRAAELPKLGSRHPEPSHRPVPPLRMSPEHMDEIRRAPVESPRPHAEGDWVTLPDVYSVLNQPGRRGDAIELMIDARRFPIPQKPRGDAAGGWQFVAVKVFEACLAQGALPTPYYQRKQQVSSRNSTDLGVNPKPVTHSGEQHYLYTNKSAKDLVRMATTMCGDAHIDPTRFKVRVNIRQMQ